MRIQHNIMAMNAYRNYNTNNSALSKNLEKLSSGYKINRAGDDAAGLAISEKMRAQITGLGVAQKNAQDGISLVQTAEGALTEVHDMLNRMVELANQSANGTYADEVDRENLQAEVDQLRSEIDRIADASNFNGINLLDGNLSEAKGLTEALNIVSLDAKKTGDLGTLGGTATNGELTQGTNEVKYSASFYIADMTNNDAGNKTITVGYKDNNGADKTVTLTIGSGKTATIDDIMKALNDGATSNDVQFTGDNGEAANSAGKGGKFNELFEVTKSGNNVLTITAKLSNGDKLNSTKSEVLDGSKISVGTIGNTFNTADVNDAIDKIKENYDGNGANAIGYGTAAGEATKYVAETKASYTVASTTLQLDAAKTGKEMHQMAVQIGEYTYIIKSGTQAVDKTIEDAVTGSSGKVKYVNVKDDDTATLVAEKLAAAISADEQNNGGTNGGFVATAANGTLTISESTNRAQHVVTENDPDNALKAADIGKLVNYELVAGSKAVNGTITVDAAKITDGTTLTFGDKTYTLTTDTSKIGSGYIQFSRNDTSQDIAKAIADALTGDGATGVTASNNQITFANAAIDGVLSKSDISMKGTGLQLQIGDTSDKFNQLHVVVQDMHTDSLGIENLSIADPNSASAAIDKIKAAINTVSSVRGTLGATQNRLEHTINNLSVMEENIQNAESAIRDTDVAEEMMDYTKNNILIQSAQAMLAQANQVPQGVLQLLG